MGNGFWTGVGMGMGSTMLVPLLLAAVMLVSLAVYAAGLARSCYRQRYLGWHWERDARMRWVLVPPHVRRGGG